MTDRQATVLWRVGLTNIDGRWHRAEHPGQRVTLASLYRSGRLVRRPFRGDGESRDSAFEYARPPYVRNGLDALKPSVYKSNHAETES